MTVVGCEYRLFADRGKAFHSEGYSGLVVKPPDISRLYQASETTIGGAEGTRGLDSNPWAR